MLSEYTVAITPEAVDPLREIVDRIRHANADAADALNDEILSAVASLAQLPERHRPRATSPYS